MLPDLLIGSIIILVPLGILILIIAIDLNSKERQLSRKIKRLDKVAGSLTQDSAKDPNSILEGLEREKLQLDDKIKHFKVYAAIMYVLIWFSLGILPLLHKLGFNWGWK